MIHRIYLDMDGVLCDFEGAAFRLFGREDLAQSPPTHGPRDLVAFLGISAAEFWHTIAKQGSQWWERLEPYPWADTIITLAYAACDNVAILSDPANCNHSAAGKLAWVGRRYSRVPVVLTREKYRLAQPGAVLIDDWARQCEAFEEEGGRAILFPAPRNSAAHRLADPVAYVRERLNTLCN